jgi:hypothetical protein
MTGISFRRSARHQAQSQRVARGARATNPTAAAESRDLLGEEKDVLPK